MSKEQMGWLANRIMQSALNDLIAACTDESGNIIAPDQKSIMQARAMLPERFPMSIVKQKSSHKKI